MQVIIFGLLMVLTPSVCLYFSALVRPSVTGEQEDFIRRVLEIPLEERSCRDLITLDYLHAFCGGPEPTPEARRLEEFSRHREYLTLIFEFILLFPSVFTNVFLL